MTFVRRQRTLAEPLIDLRLFRVPSFSVSLATNTLGFFVVLGVFFFTDQYLQLVLGLSPLWAGLWDVPPFGGFILGSLLTPLLVRSARPAYVMAGRPGSGVNWLRHPDPGRYHLPDSPP